MKSPMSPEQAAQVAKVSRRTIMRAIEALELPAVRDNRNRWKIAPEALDKWANAQWAHSGRPDAESPDSPTAPTEAPTPDTTGAALAAAQAEIRVLRERIEDLDRDRAHWRDMAQQLAARPPEAPRPFWWPWTRRKDRDGR